MERFDGSVARLNGVLMRSYKRIGRLEGKETRKRQSRVNAVSMGALASLAGASSAEGTADGIPGSVGRTLFSRHPSRLWPVFTRSVQIYGHPFDNVHEGMMKKKLTIGAIVAVLVVAIGGWYVRGAKAEDAAPYRMGEITKGTIESTVVSTGRLTAIQSVAVGTQVSGMVIDLYADYNDRVEEGQLIAKIDPILQQQSLRNAEASLTRVEAALDQAIRDSVRNQQLFDEQIITQTELDQINYAMTSARANLTSAEVNVDQARRNLSYTNIYSPIDGVVVERNVEIGQTVAASMSAPQLYLLATDLADIEILANIDESDIGLIRNGMPVRFVVSAYPNDQFEGVVRQIRLASATTENVVNYTAVISVDNSDLRLVPGMTAEVDFIAERATDVFMAPNAALRLRPTEEMIAQLTDSTMIAIASGGMGGPGGMGAPGGMGGPGAMGMGGMPGAEGPPASAPGAGGPTGDGPAMGQRRAGGGFPGGQAPNGFGAGNGGEAATQPAAPVETGTSPAVTTSGVNGVFVLGGGAPTTAGTRPGFATLWYLKDGNLGVMRVRTGISDGMTTEISGAGLEEGMEIITGLSVANAAALQEGGPANNPFEQRRGGGNFRGGFRGGF